MPNEIKWKCPHPLHVIQAFVVDMEERLFLMHRSNNVRSARNVWSLPSGTHEVGEDYLNCICRELEEEFELKTQRINLIGQYENIAGDEDAEEQYHWVITLHGILVEDATKAVNKEPDKHDIMKTVPMSTIMDDEFLHDHQFHPSLQCFIAQRSDNIYSTLRYLIQSQKESDKWLTSQSQQLP